MAAVATAEEEFSQTPANSHLTVIVDQADDSADPELSVRPVLKFSPVVVLSVCLVSSILSSHKIKISSFLMYWMAVFVVYLKWSSTNE